MNIQEIKDAVDTGKTVNWSSLMYVVIKGKSGYLIKCISNDSCVGLTNLAGDELNGDEKDFSIKKEDIPDELMKSFNRDLTEECERLLKSGALDLPTLHGKGAAVVGKLIVATAMHNLSKDYGGQMERIGLKSDLNNLRNF